MLARSKHMKLADFILTPEGRVVSQAEWARRAEVTRGYFSELVKGNKTPSIEVAWRIEQATKQAVMMQDWVSGSDSDRRLRGEDAEEVEAPPAP